MYQDCSQTEFQSAPTDSFSFCPWCGGREGSGQGGGAFLLPSPSNQAQPSGPSHFTGRVISEMILKVGILFFFKCEVEKSHTPDLAEPFLFCRASGSERVLLSSVWVSKLPWALSALQRLLKILIKNRPSCSLCLFTQEEEDILRGGAALPLL